jgi:hypothetical protein
MEKSIGGDATSNISIGAKKTEELYSRKIKAFGMFITNFT